MCFSAKASFGTGGLLLLIGTLSLSSIKRKNQIPFALIPFFFAIQQIIEGFLWLSFQDYNILGLKLTKYFTYIFLLFALNIWPIWISFSIYKLEKPKSKLRKVLFLTSFILGLATSIFLLIFLIKNGAKSNILCNHIFYDLNIPFENLICIFYSISVISPFLISENRLLWFFGTLILASLYISYFFYIQFLTSVWCFFAAVLSCFVYLVIKKS